MKRCAKRRPWNLTTLLSVGRISALMPQHKQREAIKVDSVYEGIREACERVAAPKFTGRRTEFGEPRQQGDHPFDFRQETSCNSLTSLSAVETNCIRQLPLRRRVHADLQSAAIRTRAKTSSSGAG